MSTRFTYDSLSLPIAQTATELTDRIMARLCRELSALGYPAITPSSLMFLSKLDCGNGIASELARDLGVSRQRVAKTVSDMKTAGYVRQQEGIGKRKVLSLTAKGAEVTKHARRLCAELDQKIASTDSALRLTDILLSQQALLAALKAVEVNQSGT
ncbi:MarR family transcriptional regulator [Reinekea blandensis]|uniref:Transcriptional regulator, MarR family protein n=1 Tax=Reinekea blandensis MED297 TaxID=314283 RepID=A4BI01_9GAMM|nr:MarR family transcriptional regulator [Reinekea blandensis]EAR08273.1 transcriptional regulator, MarR family protein [Reinekea sp. MED297] [Reinekea blandensis MED297]